ncbi:MAG: VanZ family protein [Ignavibacteriales bacterium]|nr:MAG: VanZ family protein [Ignavibacteriales bacterium]
MRKYLDKNKKLLIYFPLIVYWIILFISTSLPLESVPSVGLSDKLMHTVAYTGLGILLYLTLMFQNKVEMLKTSPAIFTFLIGMIYAGIDELHQLLIPGRKCDFIDILADTLGIVVGLILVIIFTRIFLPDRLEKA